MEEEDGLDIEVLKKKGIVAVCLGSSCYHALRFVCYYCPTLVRIALDLEEERDGALLEVYIMASVLPLLLLFFIATLWVKSRLLRRSITDLNLLTAFKPPQDGDLESSVAGTELHHRAARDATYFAFITWALLFFLHLLFDLFKPSLFFSHVLAIVSSAIIAFLFATTFLMNLKLLRSTTRRRTKSIVP